MRETFKPNVASYACRGSLRRLGARARAACVGLRVVADEAGRKITLPDTFTASSALLPAPPTRSIRLAREPTLSASPTIRNILLRRGESRASGRAASLAGADRRPASRARHRGCTFNDAETIRGVERLGIPVFLVNPSGLAGLYHSIAAIGRAMARESQASALLARLHAREEAVRLRPRRIIRPSFSPLTRPVHHCRAGGLHHRVAFGGRRALRYRRSPAGMDQPEHRGDPAAQAPVHPVLQDAPFGLKEMRERPGWRSLDAVRMGRVIRIDPGCNIPARSFDALEAFARQFRSVEAR